MACGCSKRRDDVIDGTNLKMASPKLTATGMYELPTAPECVRPYDGAKIGASVYVVGFHTDHPQFFTRKQRREAIRAAKGSTLDRVPAHQLCHDVMVEFFGS